MLNPNENTQNIIKTLAYFNLFNYPLTSWELWRFCGVKKKYGEFLSELNNLAYSHVVFKNGFYFLSGREDILTTRQIRYNISEHKFKRAQTMAWWLARLPWIKLVALANQIGAHNLRAEGDLDFFIITKNRRLWLSRLLVAGGLKILNLRPRDNKSQDTFCLSFWVSDQHLPLGDFRLNETDLYFTYWLASLTPLFDVDHNYRKLIDHNPWLKEALPNWQPLLANPRHLITKKTAKEKPGWPFFNWLEKLAQDWQSKHLPLDLKNIANIDTRVVINTAVAKLHAEDRREEFYNRYLNNLKI